MTPAGATIFPDTTDAEASCSESSLVSKIHKNITVQRAAQHAPDVTGESTGTCSLVAEEARGRSGDDDSERFVKTGDNCSCSEGPPELAKALRTLVRKL